MKNKKIACISLNLDSIGQAIGNFQLENDPAFSVALNRIQSTLDKFKIPCSVFVVGKDLENNANVKSLKKFIDSGNEVGNHSFSHFQNFGTLKYKEIKEEIKKTDEIILKN